VIGDFVQAKIGDVGDDHTEFGRERHRYVVQSDSVPGDYAAVGSIAKQFRWNGTPAGEDCIEIGSIGDHLGGISGLRFNQPDPERFEHSLFHGQVRPGAIGHEHGEAGIRHRFLLQKVTGTGGCHATRVDNTISARSKEKINPDDP